MEENKKLTVELDKDELMAEYERQAAHTSKHSDSYSVHVRDDPDCCC